MSEIDVSKCEFYIYNNDYCSCYRDNYGDCYHKCTDEELKDCYYRQLQQLKAENKKYKQCLDDIEEYIYSDCEYNDGCDRNICMKCKYSSIHDKRILQLIKQAKESKE